MELPAAAAAALPPRQADHGSTSRGAHHTPPPLCPSPRPLCPSLVPGLTRALPPPHPHPAQRPQLNGRVKPCFADSFLSMSTSCFNTSAWVGAAQAVWILEETAHQDMYRIRANWTVSSSAGASLLPRCFPP